MPGDTKIKRNLNDTGWIDIDNPMKVYATRWQARAARRNGVTAPFPSRSQSQPTVTFDTTAATAKVLDALGAPVDPSLTSLQRRLYDRLTTYQGVSAADAFDVIASNGYNAAASYGHMREAGATHEEALFVIGLGSTNVSVAYGTHRAVGFDHVAALKDAVVIGGMDDDNDDD